MVAIEHSYTRTFALLLHEYMEHLAAREKQIASASPVINHGTRRTSESTGVVDVDNDMCLSICILISGP